MEPIMTTIAGVFTGLVGPIVTSIINVKMKRLEIEDNENKRTFELEMSKQTSENIINEIKANIERDEVKIEGEVTLGEQQLLAETLRAEEKPVFTEKYFQYLVEASENKWWSFIVPFIAFLLAMLEVFKKSIRPGLTWYFMGVNTWVTFMAWKVLRLANQTEAGSDLVSYVFDKQQAMEIWTQSISTVQYLTVSIITWWFVDRRVAKYLRRNVQSASPQIQPPF